MKDANINHTDNITNYGHKHDVVYNMGDNQQIGKNIRTKSIGGKNSIKSNHEMENMGDLRFKIDNK